MLADRPNLNTNKSAVIKTTNGDIFLSKNHSIETNMGLDGFFQITDQDNDTVYLVNPDHIVYIGPR